VSPEHRGNRSMGTIRDATYNVNSIRSRLHIVLPWLREHRPNISCMQETKGADDGFPVSAFADEGYQVIFRGAKQYNGIAIASLEKPESVLYGLADGGPADEDRLIAAVA
jgi:exodeoxyribonuclease III